MYKLHVSANSGHHHHISGWGYSFHATQIVIKMEFYTFEQQAVSVIAFNDTARHSRPDG